MFGVDAMKQRVILHVDMNNYFASVSLLTRPDIRDNPVVVGGDIEARHGIVLAKNYPAKKLGIQTGEVLWQARQKCPNLIVIPPEFEKYDAYTSAIRDLFGRYTDQVEPYGPDECWLDITGSQTLFGDGEHIADEIRERTKRDLGLTCSVGVSDNKVWAKLGSDLKKPDGTTVITRGNYKDVVWSLPVGDLLFVGHATKKKLNNIGVETIGDLATMECSDLERYLGRAAGSQLWAFANGLDVTDVSSPFDESQPARKSYGHHLTPPRDLETVGDVRQMVCIMSESIAAQLRKAGVSCRTVEFSMRYTNMAGIVRQAKLSKPSQLTSDIMETSMMIFTSEYPMRYTLRSVGVRATDVKPISGPEQMSFLEEDIWSDKALQIERAVDGLRDRFGSHCIRRARTMIDPVLGSVDPSSAHSNFG